MLNNVNKDTEQDSHSPSEDVSDNFSTLNIDKVSSHPAFSLNIKSNVIQLFSFPYFIFLRRLIFTFSLHNQERIEVTITKTCMDVIRTLTQSFNNAVYLKSSNLVALNEAGFSSYKFINDFGVEVEVSLKADKQVMYYKTRLNN